MLLTFTLLGLSTEKLGLPPLNYLVYVSGEVKRNYSNMYHGCNFTDNSQRIYVCLMLIAELPAYEVGGVCK